MTEAYIAILSAFVGFLVWIGQKYYERQANERLRKEELYRMLLTASIELITTGNGAPFVIESQRAWLYASDNVLEDINEYLKAFANYGETKQRKEWLAVKEAEGRLRLSIRKDLKSKTNISEQWVCEKWETIVSRPERIKNYLGKDSELKKNNLPIGIGSDLTATPSHTTGHTDRVSGGSAG